jgi:hypothetical protein
LKIATIAFSTSMLVSVCASAQQQMDSYTFRQRESAFWEYAKGVLLECEHQKDRGQIRGSGALVKCSNQRLANAWAWYKLGFDDLAALVFARRLEIAERIDRGAVAEGQRQIEATQAYQQALGAAQANTAVQAQVAAHARSMAAQE